mmetsp:Transcript_4314/g.12210  ORF Transcript_4314/g.12210 Transcript_4314/m.12210 type:complete len:240 (+) Transcript_4314:79-798(+)
MDFFTCGSACRPLDPTTDTVRFDATAIGAQELQVEEENVAAARRRELEAQQQLIEQEQCRRQGEEEAEERARQEHEAQLKREQEEEARRRLQAQREREACEVREREERLRLEEEARLAEEAAQRADVEETARRVEARRAEQERARKAAVAAFLKTHGFTGGVSGAKRNLMNSTYPLHRAAKTGNAQMVEYLLLSGADAMQTNSAGRTAAQVARRHDSKNSHANVVHMLRTSGVRRVGGA